MRLHPKRIVWFIFFAIVSFLFFSVDRLPIANIQPSAEFEPTLVTIKYVHTTHQSNLIPMKLLTNNQYEKSQLLPHVTKWPPDNHIKSHGRYKSLHQIIPQPSGIPLPSESNFVQRYEAELRNYAEKNLTRLRGIVVNKATPSQQSQALQRFLQTVHFNATAAINGTGDRIVEQMRFRPETVVGSKLIHFSDQPNSPDLFSSCPVPDCKLTATNIESADVLIFKYDPTPILVLPYPRQIVALWYLESPFHSGDISLDSQVNWVFNYRRDSTIVTPYERFILYPNVTLPQSAIRDFSIGKSRLIAWFVSNCMAANNRLEYVQDLRNYVPVDIFGACGNLTCSASSVDSCHAFVRYNYKFYLAFENSNCVDYITEKFFVNALWNEVIPVVMGGRREDYEHFAPPESFIHVDDFAGPKELANYLMMLDANPNAYNSFFRWHGTGEFINTKFWCRLCALAHHPPPPILQSKQNEHKHIMQLRNWWKSNETCTKNRWDSKSDLVKEWDFSVND